MNNGDVKIRAGGGYVHRNIFHEIISLENLFSAWKEFKKGKTSKIAVQDFEFNLENNIFRLNQALEAKTWKPEPYIAFYIRDPKLRHIHKATVHDRVFNQAVFRVLYQVFDKYFIFDSYSCRVAKGTHRGVLRLDKFIRQITKNHTCRAFALKCDVRKFFDSVSHEVLLSIIRKKVFDNEILNLIEIIIKSFETAPGKGLPLGNVTSQLFANIYLNELDQFVKHKLKAKYYLRYCDDFIILDTDKEKLIDFVSQINFFLTENLKLNLHPHKITIRKTNQGIDFLGYIVMPHYIILRIKTKKRILRKIKNLKERYSSGLVSGTTFTQTVQSYLGMLEHCRGEGIRREILKLINPD